VERINFMIAVISRITGKPRVLFSCQAAHVPGVGVVKRYNKGEWKAKKEKN
jgi:hypothetical protein